MTQIIIIHFQSVEHCDWYSQCPKQHLYISLYWGSIFPFGDFRLVWRCSMCRKQDKESITVGTGEKEGCVCVPRKGVYTVSNTFPTGVTLLRSHSAPLDLGGHFAHCKIVYGINLNKNWILGSIPGNSPALDFPHGQSWALAPAARWRQSWRRWGWWGWEVWESPQSPLQQAGWPSTLLSVQKLGRNQQNLPQPGYKIVFTLSNLYNGD